MIVRESQANRLTFIYVAVGSVLFFTAMWFYILGVVRASQGLLPDGTPREVAHAVKMPTVTKVEPTRYVPPAEPTVPVY